MPSIPDASCEAHVIDADVPPEYRHDGPRSMLGGISFSVEALSRASASRVAALETGKADVGAPSLRAPYGPGGRAAAVIDPDGRTSGTIHH
jgi:hypothetical protein